MVETEEKRESQRQTKRKKTSRKRSGRRKTAINRISYRENATKTKRERKKWTENKKKREIQKYIALRLLIVSKIINLKCQYVFDGPQSALKDEKYPHVTQHRMRLYYWLEADTDVSGCPIWKAR